MQYYTSSYTPEIFFDVFLWYMRSAYCSFQSMTYSFLVIEARRCSVISWKRLKNHSSKGRVSLSIRGTRNVAKWLLSEENEKENKFLLFRTAFNQKINQEAWTEFKCHWLCLLRSFKPLSLFISLSLSIYIYIYIYVCVCVEMNIQIYIYICICIYTHTCRDEYADLYIYIYM